MTCLVYSTGGKFEVLPASAQAILGEYIEDGENHGRKVYKRKSEAGQQQVFLFYWDSRDGKDVNGWYFGDEIGGGQVWSKCDETSVAPPMKGWKCPVDGPASKHVVCVPKLRAGDSDYAPAQPAETRKRAADPMPTSRALKRSAYHTEAYILESSLGDNATKAVHKLVGEYSESGENHGRKTFKRLADDGGDQAVWLYYWDHRDGFECSGWFLGNSVGGATVYARSTQQGSKPPLKGWRIPHDGAVKSDVTLTAKASEEDAEMPDSERLQKVRDMVADLETKSEKALKTAKPVLTSKGECMEEGVRAVYDLLQGELDSLMDAKGSLERHVKAAATQSASDDAQSEMTLEEEKLDGIIMNVEKEMSKAREALSSAELGAAVQKDTKTLDKALLAAMEVVGNAEAAAEAARDPMDAIRAQELAQSALQTVNKTLNSSRRFVPAAWTACETDFVALRERCLHVEKSMSSFDRGFAGAGETQDQGVGAAIASLPAVDMSVEQAEESVEAAITAASEHKAQMKYGVDAAGDGGKGAMEETQAAADAAQDAIAVARGLTDGLARAAKQLPAAEQKSLLEDVSLLRKRTGEAQKKLNPHKRARYEYGQKLKAKEETDVFDTEMSAVEAEVEKVVKVFAGSPSEAEVKAAEGALPGILGSLSEKMRAIEQKALGAGASAGVFVAILGRAKAAMEKVEELKTSSRERRKELKAEGILREAQAAVKTADDWLAKIAKAEEPWAGNVEVVPDATAKPALKACADIAEKAEPAVKASKVVVMEKLVDVRQLPEGPLRFETAEALVKLQDKVEKAALAVTQLKIDTYARKTKLLMPEVIVAVSVAEDKLQSVLEGAAALEEDTLEKGGKPAAIKAACKAVIDAEKAVAKECASARTVVESKKNDPKFGISPSFRTQLMKLDGRVDAAEKKLAKMKEAAATADKSKGILDGQKKELEKLKALAEEIELAALPLGDEMPADDENGKTAELIESTRDKLGQWQAKADELAATAAHGSLRHAMKRLAADGVQLQATLAEARATAGARLHRAFARIFVREGQVQVKKAEEAMVKAGQAEGPFLKGVELSSEQTAKAIAQCQEAASAAQAVVDLVCGFFKVRCKEASTYSKADASMKSDVAALTELSEKAFITRTKLNQFVKDTAQRKNGGLN